MNLNAYALTSVLALVFNTGIGILVALKSANRPLGRRFGIVSLAITLWIIGCAGQSLFDTRYAHLFDLILYTGVSLAPTFYLHFLITYTGRTKTNRLLISISYGLSVFFLFLNWVPQLRLYLIKGTTEALGFRSIAVPGPLWYGLIAFYLYCVSSSFFPLFRDYRTADQERKNQTKYFLIAYGFLITAGTLYFAMMLGLSLPPIDNILSMSYGVLMSYAMIKHRLMDIRIFMRRAALLLLIYLSLIIIILPFIALIHKKVAQVLPGAHQYVVWEVLLASLVLSAGPFLYALFIKRNDYFHEHTMAGLTHELKSPLAAIESALDLLMDQVKKEPASLRQAEYLEMIDRNSARLRKYIDDLLLMMKVGSGRSSLSLTKTHLGDLCSSVVRQFGSATQAKGVELELKASVNGSRALCDPAKVEQIISNLLSNAIKFTDRGKITVSIKEDKNTLNVEVTDTGKGIPSNELPYLFDRFYQGEAGRNAKGTGIGLTIAKAWVEAHGGEIHAESDGPGKGSRFWFTLPKG